MSKEKIYLTWNDVNNLLDKLHQQTNGIINYVTGVPRGGIILAVLYSHRFNIPYMEFKNNNYPDMLILDDIADSGATFENIQDNFPIPKKGALHYKSSCSYKPDFFAEEIDDDFGWIVYPWERKDSKTVQDYLA